MKFFRILFRLILAMLSIIPFILLAISLYETFQNVYGLSAMILLLTGSLWIGYVVYDLINEYGVFKIISYSFTSSDMDHLKTENDSSKKL